jgi:hypothetical protein
MPETAETTISRRRLEAGAGVTGESSLDPPQQEQQYRDEQELGKVSPRKQADVLPDRRNPSQTHSHDDLRPE